MQRGEQHIRVERARALRRRSTDAERRLWYHLRNRRLADLKFRRQYPIGPSFADFACVEIGLVVEIDGGQHGHWPRLQYDRHRTRQMQAAGWRVLRFWNDEVLVRTGNVLEHILRIAELTR